MVKRSFTLIEIVVVVILVGILTTIAIPGYQYIIENSKNKVCETNLKALGMALDIYAMEHDIIPSNLTQIPSKTIQRAYAQVLKENGDWQTKFAYFVMAWQNRGLAYAFSLKDDIARGDLSIITCPADKTAPLHGGISYGINSAILGMNYQQYANFTGPTIADCDQNQFASISQIVKRHKRSETKELKYKPRLGIMVIWATKVSTGNYIKRGEALGYYQQTTRVERPAE